MPSALALLSCLVGPVFPLLFLSFLLFSLSLFPFSAFSCFLLFGSCCSLVSFSFSFPSGFLVTFWDLWLFDLNFSLLEVPLAYFIRISSFAMAAASGASPAEGPWETPDALTSVYQLQGLLGQGFSIGHDSTGDLQALMHSAFGGVRKEVDQHMELLETEHVEHKTDPHYQRKMVRFWKCSSVTLHPSKNYTTDDVDQDLNHVYYQWARMQNLPGWWVKKIWHSQDGWLLVAKKEGFNLLIHDAPLPIDQRNLVEETLSSESSMENQRQNMGADMARQALQHFLHLSDNAIHGRERSRSPRGQQDLPYVNAAPIDIAAAGPLHPNLEEVTLPPAL